MPKGKGQAQNKREERTLEGGERQYKEVGSLYWTTYGDNEGKIGNGEEEAPEINEPMSMSNPICENFIPLSPFKLKPGYEDICRSCFHSDRFLRDLGLKACRKNAEIIKDLTFDAKGEVSCWRYE